MDLRKLSALLIVPALGLMLGGCEDLGKAEKGDEKKAQQQFESQPPEKQITQLYYAPIPAAEREQKIQEIEKKYGIKRPDPPAGGGPQRG